MTSPGLASTVFLWGGPPPIPEPGKFIPRGDKWWSQYQSAMRVSPVARKELARSSREIASLLPDPVEWSDSPNPFRALVVGAVQSGKTASMMGVAAVALDQGYRIIVVLAGGKDDLRTQTARRFNTQLLRQSDSVAGSKTATTLGTPRGAGPLGGFAPPYQLDANQFALLQVRMEATLSKGQPCVVVAKKNVASLRDLHSALHACYGTFGVEALPTLVFDDECDDASVDSEDKTIPAAIANLWRREGQGSVNAAYVGYTATAAANLLQDPSNELYPEHAVYLLRYPGEEATAIQFAEPSPDAWYSGGECFYRAFGEEPGEAGNFLIDASVQQAHLSAPVTENPSLEEALRAYFVGGAFRLALDPGRGFGEGMKRPEPHSMLVQTSATTEEHQRWARALEQLLGGRRLPDRTVAFDAEHLMREVAANEVAWRAWFDRFDNSRERVHEERPHGVSHRPLTWNQVRTRLRDVFENSRLKVVNSDPVTGANLDFAPQLLPSGASLPPQDVFVIVVGGSRLSRGLTVEGLTVSYFVRWTPSPTEDTVLQMSRWFGYRGSYLEYCRVFTTAGIADSLRQMHENDVDLRFQLAELMSLHRTPREATLILRSNPKALPTGKLGVGVVVDLAYSPFTSVLRNVEIGPLAARNEETALALVAEIRKRDGRIVRSSSGAARGVLSRGWTVAEIAEALESLEYSTHNPECAANPMRGHYRKEDSSRPVSMRWAALDDPYQVAAYLRAWSADAAKRDMLLPLFNVGVSFGEMEEGREPFDFPLVNRQVTSEGHVIGGWTGRSTNWEGDAYFDRPAPEFRRPGSQQRLAGADGLLLLYVIHRDATGKAGRGARRSNHSPMLAVSIPSGGPPYRRVVV